MKSLVRLMNADLVYHPGWAAVSRFRLLECSVALGVIEASLKRFIHNPKRYRSRFIDTSRHALAYQMV